MRYSFLSAAILALTSPVVFAQFFDSITSPTRDQIIPVGEPFDIIWAPEGVTGTISITLLEGKTNITLEEGPIIKAGVNNLDGKYTWTPTENKFDTYGFIIKHEQNKTLTQYSQPFHLSGGSSESTTGYPTTTTIKLSTGPSYTATSTTSVPSSTVTVISTSTSAPTSNFSTPYPSSNLTISNTLTSTRASTPTTGSPTTGSPSSSGSSVATGAAVAQFASGGLAMVGGLVLAFAL